MELSLPALQLYFIAISFIIGGNCLNSSIYADIDGPCTLPTDCPTHASCVSSFCKCDSDFIPSTDKRRCLATQVPIGELCELDGQCVSSADSSSACATDSEHVLPRCLCRSSHVPSGDSKSCLPKVGLEEACKETVQCKNGFAGPLSICSDVTNVCECTADAIVEPISKICYAKLNLNDPCDHIVQCGSTSGAVCSGNPRICQCPANYIPSLDKSQCLPWKYLGETCSDTQCNHIVNAECVRVSSTDPTTICRCKADYVNPTGVTNQCFAVAKLVGDTCAEHDVQCWRQEGNVGIKNTVCHPETKTCRCGDAFIPSNGITECLLLQATLNTECKESQQCRVTNSECHPTAKECLCKDEFVESVTSPTNKCVQVIREIKEKCEEDIQCSEGIPLSSCSHGQCQCSRTNYVYLNGECHIPATLGGLCHKHEECYVGVTNLTVCTAAPGQAETRCRCLPDTIQYNGKCYEPKKIKDRCSENVQCTVSIRGESFCDASTGVCECKLGHPPTGNAICAGSLIQVSYFLLFLLVASLKSLV